MVIWPLGTAKQARRRPSRRPDPVPDHLWAGRAGQWHWGGWPRTAPVSR